MNTIPDVKLKRSLVQGKIPTINQLGIGELAINHYDGEAFIRKDGVGVQTSVVEVGNKIRVYDGSYVGVVTSLNFGDNLTVTTPVSGIATVNSSAGVAYTVSSSAPLSPQTGQKYYNLEDAREYTYIDDGNSSQWLDVSSGGGGSGITLGIATAGGTVGTGVTLIDFRGTGISTVTVSSGIATINISGGGGSATPNISPVIMGMIF